MPTQSRSGPVLPKTDLAASNTLLRLALEAGTAVAWDWDVRSGRDSWFGDLQTIFGIPSTTHSGHVQDFRQRVHPELIGSIGGKRTRNRASAAGAAHHRGRLRPGGDFPIR